MEKNEHREESRNSEIRRRFKQDKRSAGGGIEVDNGEKKVKLMKELASVKGEESRIHMEYVENEDAIINELMRLSGLIAQLRMLDNSVYVGKVYGEFEVLFNKYMKKLRE